MSPPSRSPSSTRSTSARSTDGPLDVYRAWAASHPPDEPAPGGGDSRASAAARFARGLRAVLARPERQVVLVVARARPPLRARCSSRSRTASLIAPVEHAVPHPSRETTSSGPRPCWKHARAAFRDPRSSMRLGRVPASRRCASLCAATILAASRPSPWAAAVARARARAGICRGLARPSTSAGARRAPPAPEPRRTTRTWSGDPPARPDRAGRRRHLPRLGRRRLHLSLARARGARLPRLGRPRRPRPAGRRIGRGRAALPRAPGRAGRSHAPPAETEAALRELRYELTAGARAACDGPHGVGSGRDGALPARLVGRHARDQGYGARTASSARSSPSGARRRRRTAASSGSRSVSTRRTRDTKRGLVRDEILPLLRRLHPGAERNLLALAEERPRLPRALERTLVELLSSTAGTKSADLGGGIRAVRDYDELRLEGSVRVRTLAPRDRPARASSCARAARAIVSRAGARRCRISSWTRRCPARSATPGRSSCRGDAVVAVPGVAEAPGWEGAVRAWKDVDA